MTPNDGVHAVDAHYDLGEGFPDLTRAFEDHLETPSTYNVVAYTENSNAYYVFMPLFATPQIYKAHPPNYHQKLLRLDTRNHLYLPVRGNALVVKVANYESDNVFPLDMDFRDLRDCYKDAGWPDVMIPKKTRI